MRNQIFTIRDKVAEESGTIFEAKNIGIATRMYKNLLKDQPYKDDFDLLLLGEINHNNDELIKYDSIESIPVTFSPAELGG